MIHTIELIAHVFDFLDEILYFKAGWIGHFYNLVNFEKEARYGFWPVEVLVNGNLQKRSICLTKHEQLSVSEWKSWAHIVFRNWQLLRDEFHVQEWLEKEAHCLLQIPKSQTCFRKLFVCDQFFDQSQSYSQQNYYLDFKLALFEAFRLFKGTQI